MIMHLMVNNICWNKCPECCNKFYDIHDIPFPTQEELETAETVCFTGGEPFLNKELFKIARNLKNEYPNVKNIYVYTSGAPLLYYFSENPPYALDPFDGITICPKSKDDFEAIDKLFFANNYLSITFLRSVEGKSNRMLIFDNLQEIAAAHNIDKIKHFEILGRKWDTSFNTPKDEIFRRFPILL